MEQCQIPKPDMLPNPVRLKIDDETCDFDCAREKAIAQATVFDKSPRLLSWYDAKRKLYAPNDECCVPGEPNWLAYALARKADFSVDVNDEEYVFVFKGSQLLP